MLFFLITYFKILINNKSIKMKKIVFILLLVNTMVFSQFDEIKLLQKKLISNEITETLLKTH